MTLPENIALIRGAGGQLQETAIPAVYYAHEQLEQGAVAVGASDEKLTRLAAVLENTIAEVLPEIQGSINFATGRVTDASQAMRPAQETITQVHGGVVMHAPGIKPLEEAAELLGGAANGCIELAGLSPRVNEELTGHNVTLAGIAEKLAQCITEIRDLAPSVRNTAGLMGGAAENSHQIAQNTAGAAAKIAEWAAGTG